MYFQLSVHTYHVWITKSDLDLVCCCNYLNIIFEKYLTENTAMHESLFIKRFGLCYLLLISFFFHEMQSLNPPVLIFVQSKERAKELYKELAFDDVRADVIHADLNEQQVLLCILLLLLFQKLWCYFV